MQPPSILATVVLVLLAGAAAHDVATRTVPNWFSAGIAAAGIVMRLLAGDLRYGLVFALAVFAGAAALWWFRLMGGADAKLLGAVALVVPPLAIPGLLLVTALCGGALALVYLVLSRMVTRPRPGRRRTLLGRVAKAELWRLSRCGPLPYATAIAAGSAVALSPQLWG
jgi:prepilin peptidase CpaA